MFFPFFILVSAAVAAALLFALYNFYSVKKLDSGTKEMTEIAVAISEGTEAFIAHEYRIIVITCAVAAVLLATLLDILSGLAFILGSIMSGLAGIVGMKIATIANVRVADAARTAKSLGKTLKIAFRGGSVMGLCVSGFALLGLLLCYLVFGKALGLAETVRITQKTNWMGISYIPFTMIISSYALGCSVVALFNRIGGGIYTKAADMGADLVGKTEEHIPEDDPRNPAAIDGNAGGVAGLGSDLLESYAGAIISSAVLAAYMFFTASGRISPEILEKLMLFPISFSGLGALVCVLGIAYVLLKKPSGRPHRELNIALWSSAALIVAGGAFLSWLFFRGDSFALATPLLGGFIGGAVGGPLKDTVGPSLDILIKIMAAISLIGVSIFGKFNLLALF
jgi:K(+)-stimulated pyrophosphate-energized sodium pump